MTRTPRPRAPAVQRAAVLGLALAAAACTPNGEFDWDLRSRAQGSTADAALRSTDARPVADARGVLSYPGYQVATARRGDTVASVAARVGLDAGELARANALQPGDGLREGEILALPRRVAADPVPTGGIAPGGAITGGPIDVTTIAGAAIDRAAPGAGSAPAAGGLRSEPVRHRVARGETAIVIARQYGIPVRSLQEWNGLGPDMALREGQTLLIPTSSAPPPAPVADAARPGAGSSTPLPPSAAQPLPAERPATTAAAAAAAPASPAMGTQRTGATAARMAMPVDGRIIRPFAPPGNQGIDIAAPPGTAVRAAAAGTVAVVSRDTSGVAVLILRHDDGLLTVYTQIDGITAKKDDRVARGQTIARVRAGDPAFLHFEVRRGRDALDPVGFLQ
ncbi:MAG TPA: peptidoglycan DD-metalloendopeptidase family protein [Paracoccaceae bacterium]|nr:peptidoglycan DD-metalloendopeptidase family protein [Verrucomicrobiota bacterium]HMO73228.1 peptidoglycan DD-metalloendopeptidase family protein [Paracoccaceae bacterium]